MWIAYERYKDMVDSKYINLREVMQQSRLTPDSFKLIVTNLSDEVKEEDLRLLFQGFGNCRISLKLYPFT